MAEHEVKWDSQDEGDASSTPNTTPRSEGSREEPSSPFRQSNYNNNNSRDLRKEMEVGWLELDDVLHDGMYVCNVKFVFIHYDQVFNVGVEAYDRGDFQRATVLFQQLMSGQRDCPTFQLNYIVSMFKQRKCTSGFHFFQELKNVANLVSC
jgi:hypothetical protein